MDHEWKGQNKVRIRLHIELGTALDSMSLGTL